MKIRIVSARMERCTTTDSSHNPGSDQTSAHQELCFKSRDMLSLNVRRPVSDMMMPDALLTAVTLSSLEHTHDDVQVLVTDERRRRS